MDGADIRIPPPDDIEEWDTPAAELMPPVCIGAGEERGSILGPGIGLSLFTAGVIRIGGVVAGLGAVAETEAGAG